LGQYNEAIDSCNTAIDLADLEQNNHDESFAYLYKGLALSEIAFTTANNETYTQAIKCFNEAIQHGDPKDHAYVAEALGGRGSVYAQLAVIATSAERTSATRDEKYRDSLLIDSCNDCANSSKMDSSNRFAYICKGDYNFSLGVYDEFATIYLNNDIFNKYATTNYTNSMHNYEDAIWIDGLQVTGSKLWSRENWDKNIWAKISEVDLRSNNESGSAAANKEEAKISSSLQTSETQSNVMPITITGILKTVSGSQVVTPFAYQQPASPQVPEHTGENLSTNNSSESIQSIL